MLLQRGPKMFGKRVGSSRRRKSRERGNTEPGERGRKRRGGTKAERKENGKKAMKG
jgi:hypothetical protein